MPHDVRAEFERAAALHREGQIDKAIAIYRKLAKARPDLFEVQRLLVFAQIQSGHVRDALVTARRICDGAPRNAQAQVLLGAALQATGRLEKALAAYETAAELAPELAEAHYLGGNMHGALGEHEKAVACFTRVLEIDPRTSEALLNRATALRRLGRPEEALADYERLATMQPWEPRFRVLAAELLGGLGRPGEALAAAAEAVRIAPRDADAHAALGSARLAENDLKGALIAFEVAAARAPERMELRACVIDLQRRLGNLSAAAAACASALDAVPGDPVILFARAGLRHAEGDAAGALADVEAALDTVPEWEEAAHFRATLAADLAQAAARAGDSAGEGAQALSGDGGGAGRESVAEGSLMAEMPDLPTQSGAADAGEPPLETDALALASVFEPGPDLAGGAPGPGEADAETVAGAPDLPAEADALAALFDVAPPETVGWQEIAVAAKTEVEPLAETDALALTCVFSDAPAVPAEAVEMLQATPSKNEAEPFAQADALSLASIFAEAPPELDADGDGAVADSDASAEAGPLHDAPAGAALVADPGVPALAEQAEAPALPDEGAADAQLAPAPAESLQGGALLQPAGRGVPQDADTPAPDGADEAIARRASIPPAEGAEPLPAPQGEVAWAFSADVSPAADAPAPLVPAPVLPSLLPSAGEAADLGTIDSGAGAQEVLPPHQPAAVAAEAPPASLAEEPSVDVAAAAAAGTRQPSETGADAWAGGAEPNPDLIEAPLWDGVSHPAALVVRAEAEAADTVLLARLLRLLADRGIATTLLASPAEAALFARLDPRVRVATQARDAGIGRPGVAFVQLGELPRLLASEATSWPQPPYLPPDPSRVAHWRSALDAATADAGVEEQVVTVGLFWPEESAGGGEVPPAALTPLAGIPGVRLVALGPAPYLAGAPFAERIVRLDFDPWADSGLADAAALLQHIDLLVTDAGPVAHLAGARGRPAFVGVESNAHWSWGSSGPTAPHYPQLRLFRQSRAGEWGDVASEMVQAMIGLLRQA